MTTYKRAAVCYGRFNSFATGSREVLQGSLVGRDAPPAGHEVFAFATADILGCPALRTCLAGCVEVVCKYVTVFVYFYCCYDKTP